MGRPRAASGWLATIMLLVAQPAFAASPAGGTEPAMRLTWHLSSPAATEEERDLLRREYRLIRLASEFWAGFDSLNARIHGSADLLRSLRGLVEGTAPPAPHAQSLLAGLDAASVAPAPIAAALPQAPAASAPAEEEGGLEWGLGAAVLGGLTFLLLRRRAAVPAPPVATRRVRTAAKPAAPKPLVPPASQAPPTAAAPPQTDDEAESLKRHTAPMPETPSAPVDPVREEMDHAISLADVMLSYGRTTGAMQALKDYLHDHPTVSVRPWLKLLDLHRQTGMREDFERAAGTVHQHFNVKVPGWDEGVSGVPLRSFFDDEEHTEILGLEQLPHILAQIQATWPEASGLEYLRHLLVDNRGGGRVGFPVSVVAEILLLEDILNDRLAGQA